MTTKRPPPPDDFEESPEWTEADFAEAKPGLPKSWRPSDALRTAAAELRHQAELLDGQADALDDRDLRKAG